jgi:phospholipase/lecithinase/hemolysin
MQQWILANGTQEQALYYAPLGKMAMSAINQMKMHLVRNGGSYSGKELVVVSIAANDLFLNITAIPLAENGGQEAYVSAVFAGWDEATQAIVSSSPDQNLRVSTALLAGHAYMSNAATELLANVKTLILDKGAKNVVIMNLSDVGLTSVMQKNPDPQVPALATSLTKAFNDTLVLGIRSLPGVLLVDTFTESQRQAANPAQYGLTNVKDVTCGYALPPYKEVLKDSSLGCSAATVVAGDTSRYLYADGVHPTPYGHLLLANFFTNSLEAAGLGR